MVREGVARGEWIIAYARSNDNEADLLTKLPVSEKRRCFVRNIIKPNHHNGADNLIILL